MRRAACDGGVRVVLEHAARGAGLHDDRGEVVREDVVQLAGDAGALPCDRALAVVGADLLGAQRLARELPGERPVRAQQPPAQPGHEDEEERGEDDVAPAP